jgi:Zn ribbon nucleic-acid-binding protein
MEDELLTECPNCNAIWSMEEIDEQYCYACGYPDPNEDDLDEESNYYSLSSADDIDDLI